MRSRAASPLFRQRGIEAVSVLDVMAQVGLTAGGFYRYFESKEAAPHSNHRLLSARRRRSRGRLARRWYEIDLRRYLRWCRSRVREISSESSAESFDCA
jgi:AcrR family transcriptional regulator